MEIVDQQKRMHDMRDLTRSERAWTAGVADFVRRVVTTAKPRLTVEQRSEAGFTLALLQGLNDNGYGKLIVCNRDAEKFALIKKETTDFEISPSVSIEIRNQSAAGSKFEGSIDLLVCSMDHEQVVRHLLPQINPCGLILLHAAEGDFAAMREFALGLDKKGVVSVVLLPATLKLVMAQSRGARK